METMTETVVCIDRDGTLIYDDRYYLGRQENWREMIEFLAGVVEGVRRLNSIPATTYMITNQSGVAVKDFDRLTEEKAREVCQEILDRLSKQGAEMDGYYLCPHVPPDYEDTHPDLEVEEEKVCHCECIKPNTGMVDNVLEDAGIEKEGARVYVIGDRASDVKTALNASGTGILVPFENQEGEKQEVRDMESENAYIADDFLDAAKFVEARES